MIAKSHSLCSIPVLKHPSAQCTVTRVERNSFVRLDNEGAMTATGLVTVLYIKKFERLEEPAIQNPRISTS
jgi:hypothetical protein